MKTYFISGIASDNRVFRYIELPQGFEAVLLDWIVPIENESLQQYSLRLSKQIDPSEPFILLGFSLGGILATEIANQLKPAATILIASVPVASQLPAHFSLAKKLKLHKLIPVSFLKMSASMTRLFTAESLANKKLMLDMMRKTDSAFIKWAINAVLDWKNEVIPDPCWHIHGTRDEVFPIALTRPTHVIQKAGHNLPMSRPSELNILLRQILEQKQ